jgi:hypothetical protein
MIKFYSTTAVADAEGCGVFISAAAASAFIYNKCIG